MKDLLVVEDDKTLNDLLVKKFTEEGFNVATGQNGQEAFEKIQQKRPDLILLDIVMPVMDGITFLKTIKQSPNKDIPIIMLTNLTEDVRVIEALETGVTDYLVKSDYMIQEVVDAVKRKLGI